MISDGVTASLTFNQDVRGGVEPAGTTIDLRVEPDGFFDPGGVGSAGQSAEPIAPRRVAETLLQYFEPAALRAILDHITQLRTEIDSAG
jgi:hypothetical protein